MTDIHTDVQTLLQTPDYEKMTEWFAPRAAALPDGRAVMLLTLIDMSGSDVFLGFYQSTSTDRGATWTEPTPIEALKPQTREDGTVCAPCDLVPTWHEQTGKVLACGSVANYTDARAKHPLKDNGYPRQAVWTVYDPGGDSWSPWRSLPLDEEHFFWAIAGASQRCILPGGEILQPVYAMPREHVGDNFWKSCFFATVLRCRFDGETLEVVEQGNELSVADPRGFCEPSLVEFRGRFLLTLRNDVRGYVAESSDGLDFEQPKPWAFDDGEEMGSYNTQQHWVRLGDRLMLVYTRRGADNDHVVRHRAPLFLGEVDPEKLVVIRDSERVLLPNRGGAFGNNGVTQVSEREAWVTDAELMQGDAENPYDLERTRARGADNRVYLARLTC